MTDFVIDAYSEGKHDWTLSSPKAELREEENSIRVQTPDVRFYEENEPSSTFAAGQALLDTNSKDIWAWDGVVMTSTDGARLNSEWLRYISDRDLIVSTAPVTVVRGGTTIKGVGWEATPDLSQLTVERQEVEIDSSEDSGSRVIP